MLHGELYLMDNYFALFSLYKIGKYKFLAIPKNCSTTLLEMAEKHIVNITNNYDKNTIGIIRDPIDRWIAGQTHMMYRHENQNQFYERFENLDISGDEHVHPQIDFLGNKDMQMYRMIGSDFLQNLFDKLGIIKTVRSRNVTTCKEKIKLKNIITNIVNSNSKLKEKLIDYYKKDYDIYNFASTVNKIS